MCMNKLQELNIQIESMKKDQLEKESMEKKRNSLKREYIQLKNDLQKAKTSYYKEKKDVDKLTSLSFQNLFSSIVGNKGEKLSKEEAELFEAKRILDNFKEQKEEIESEMENIDQTIDKLGESKEILPKLLEEKRLLILELNPSLEAEIKSIEQEIDLKNVFKQELSDVYKECNKALSAITNSLNHVKDAIGWGTIDMFFNGGILTHMKKHEEIKSAKQSLNFVNSSLKRLNSELKDIGRHKTQIINISTSDLTLDFWFDNIFTDWSIQSKLKATESDLENAKRQISGLASKTRQKMRDIDSIIEKHKLEIKKQISNY